MGGRIKRERERRASMRIKIKNRTNEKGKGESERARVNMMIACRASSHETDRCEVQEDWGGGGCVCGKEQKHNGTRDARASLSRASVKERARCSRLGVRAGSGRDLGWSSQSSRRTTDYIARVSTIWASIERARDGVPFRRCLMSCSNADVDT